MYKQLEQDIKDNLQRQHAFFTNPENFKKIPNQIGLYTGKAGIALLLSLYCQATGDEKARQSMETVIDNLMQHLEELDRAPAAFCGGLAGVGWLFQYLDAKKLLSVDIDDFLEDLDIIAESDLSVHVIRKEFDLLHSGLGVGYYLLKRGKFKEVEKLIDAIEKTAINTDGELKWERFDTYHSRKEIYDFGLAHGNAGYLFFLAACYEKDIMRDRVEKMMRGNIRFFLNNIRDLEQVNSYLPTSTATSEYRKIPNLTHSRLGWCYGDLGDLYTLLYAAEKLKDQELYNHFLGMMEILCRRTADGLTNVNDACFCHGASGNGLIFMKMYKKTGNPVFLEAARFWTHKTLSYATTPDEGVCGFLFLVAKEDYKPDISFLNGLSGVSALLLSMAYPDLDHTWSECFFIC